VTQHKRSLNDEILGTRAICTARSSSTTFCFQWKGPKLTVLCTCHFRGPLFRYHFWLRPINYLHSHLSRFQRHTDQHQLLNSLTCARAISVVRSFVRTAPPHSADSQGLGLKMDRSWGSPCVVVQSFCYRCFCSTVRKVYHRPLIIVFWWGRWQGGDRAVYIYNYNYICLDIW
jgi:hypothetical protein